MAKRIAICPITLATPGGGPDFGNRPSIADHLGDGGGYNTLIPTLSNGSPKFVRCPVQFVTEDLPTVSALANVTLLPDYPFDAALTGMGADTLDGFLDDMAAIAIDGEGTHLDLTGYNAADSYGTLVLRILRQFQEGYPNLAAFDVRG